jgi:hypothetical protein
MIRKQVYLTTDLERRIRIQSRTERKPEALVIRELLEKALRYDNFDATIAAALKKADALATKHGRVTPPDLSVRLDDYLYGNDRR